MLWRFDAAADDYAAALTRRDGFRRVRFGLPPLALVEAGRTPRSRAVVDFVERPCGRTAGEADRHARFGSVRNRCSTCRAVPFML